MKKIQISPSILSADFSQLGNEIKRLEEGGADMIHVDVMDGHFVPNLTIGPPAIKALRNYTKLPFDVHLMIKPVHKYIKNYAEAGADIITIHPEATDNLNNSIKHIKELGKKVGVSLNPETKTDIIKELLTEIDLILIMSVHPGFGGQKFIPEVISKIKELKNIKLKENLKIDKNTEKILSSYKPTIFWKDKEIIKQQLNIWTVKKIKPQIKEINELENQIKKNSQISSLTINNFIFDSLNNINN